MAANICPTCRTEIPAQAPAGLCPRCLMNGGLESGAQPQPFIAATLPSPHPTPPGGFVPPELMELNHRFPQLEILELLGKGGMGAVYKARQRGLDRIVALKILPPEIGHDPAFAERFTREARALGRLSHPNIVAVYDFGQIDGLYYFLMEFIDGANLRQAIRAGGITSKDALAIVGQVCDALQFAHDEGIVHRDIKPENILIDKRGRVKIADFGLAKLLGGESLDHSLTGTHQVMGTLRYMAPEQMEGAKEVDHRADIFSLGVVFYELLTGQLPVGRFAPPSKTIGVDIRLDEVVLRALEREPTLRYQHASEVKTQVQAIEGLSPSATQHKFGWEYRSQAELLGWPLLHVAFGLDAKTGKRKIAKGVIAIGDLAIGGLALGGCSMGVVACGGVSLGLISFGGLSAGLLLAVGGLALGLLSFGGLAIGAISAGGCAVGYYAYGGAAFGGYTMTGEYQHPHATELFDYLTRNWTTGLIWLGLASPAFLGLIFISAWTVSWAGKPSTGSPIEQTRTQLVTLGRLLIAMGIAMLILCLPIIVVIGVWAQKANMLWLMPLLIVQMVYSPIAGALVIRSGMNLGRFESIGFATMGVVLCMIPLSVVAIVGLPFGFWALSILNRRETTLIVEEEKQLRDKAEITARSALADQESIWHDLGVIVGYFLRDKTVQTFLGGAAMLAYVLCLVMFFSFQGGSILADGVTTYTFEVGQPSPWYVVKTAPTGQSSVVVFNSWSVLVAILGIICLLAARKLEELRYGKVHAMAWHYAVWGALVIIVFVAGTMTLVSHKPVRTKQAVPAPDTSLSALQSPLA
jgi:predicted Ser/Thr protein kinase